MSSLERRLDRLTRLLKRLSDHSNRGTPIIVEGRKDEESLRKLGIEGPILCLKAEGKGLFEFLEGIDSVKRVIALTDFDTEGKKLAKMLVSELSKRRIKVDDFIWKKVGALIRKDIHTVQELGNCIEGMRAQFETSKEKNRVGTRPKKP